MLVRRLVSLPSDRVRGPEADLTGHSTCHKVVNFKGDESLEGEIVDVLITKAKTNSLVWHVGEIAWCLA